VTDPGIASLRSQLREKPQEKQRVPCLGSHLSRIRQEPFTNKFSFARMLSIRALVEFAAFFNKLAHERGFENAELSGGGSLGSHRGSAPARIFGLLVIAMQDAAGSLFDGLDTALQSGSS